MSVNQSKIEQWLCTNTLVRTVCLFGFALLFLLNLSEECRVVTKFSAPLVFNSKHQEQQHSSWAREFSNEYYIFYNIFIPPDQEGIERALEIVREQVGFLGASYAVQGANFTDVIIKYVTIGADALSSTFMDEVCKANGVSCHLVKHYPEANEQDTLQHLYEFCRAATSTASSTVGSNSIAAADVRVAYMHSKGSYHHNWYNPNWRRHMTMAIGSEPCLRALDNTTCNICGLQFYPLWTLFFIGNFWTTHCSYINTLVPIADYERILHELHFKISIAASESNLSRTLFEWADHTLGNGRFSAELWVGSSPHLIPCDVSKEQNTKYWQYHQYNPDQFEFSMAPRHPLVSQWHLANVNTLAQVVNDPIASRWEYFLLVGHLLKWKALYHHQSGDHGIFPPDDSWLWTYFPEGQYWKDGIQDGSFDLFYDSIINII